MDALFLSSWFVFEFSHEPFFVARKSRDSAKVLAAWMFARRSDGKADEPVAVLDYSQSGYLVGLITLLVC